MRKIKRTLLIILAVCLVLGGLWVFWTRDVPLGAQLLEEDWYYVSLVGIYGGQEVEHVGYTLDEEASRKILDALDTAVVNRRLTEPRGGEFWIVLCPEAHKMVSILVDNGGITVAEADRERYYDGGEELYEFLRQLVQTLPVSNSDK